MNLKNKKSTRALTRFPYGLSSSKRSQTANPFEDWLPWALWIFVFLILLFAVYTLIKKLGAG
jgi:hypothetical protein